MKIYNEDEDKSLNFILDKTNLYNIQSSYFIKFEDENNKYYGRLDVELGFQESLDEHCDQCFNEIISWLRFAGDNINCQVYLFGIVGFKKFNHFKNKNSLNQIFGSNIEIINTII